MRCFYLTVMPSPADSPIVHLTVCLLPLLAGRWILSKFMHCLVSNLIASHITRKLPRSLHSSSSIWILTSCRNDGFSQRASLTCSCQRTLGAQQGVCEIKSSTRAKQWRQLWLVGLFLFGLKNPHETNKLTKNPNQNKTPTAKLLTSFGGFSFLLHHDTNIFGPTTFLRRHAADN